MTQTDLLSSASIDADARRQVIVRTPQALTLEEMSDWQALVGKTGHDSPLLCPEFARLVGLTRSDVRCILLKEGNTLIAAMAVHARKGGHGRAIGAPFDDCSGPVILPGSDATLEEMIKGAGFDSYRANACSADPSCLPADVKSEVEPEYVIHPGTQSPEEYIEAQRAQHPKRVKNYRRLARKLENELGKVELVWGPPDPARLKTLLAWKSAQFQADGLVDITRATHSRLVLEAVAAIPYTSEMGYGGFMVELHLNGALISGHYGVRNRTFFHPWISAYDPRYSDYSPGITLVLKVIHAMKQMGLETYNLSAGHEHYKKYFAPPSGALRSVNITTDSLRGALQRAGFSSWNMIGAREDTSVAARLRRRLDHIAACEPGMASRLSEFLLAIGKRR